MKKMKKLILLITITALPYLSYGQSIFEQLEKWESISSVVITKDAFEILSKFNIDMDDEENSEMEIFKMVDDLNELRVYSTNNSLAAQEMLTLVDKDIKSKKLTELMKVKDGNSRVLIYVRSGKNKDFVSEVLMFIKGIDEKTKGMAESMIVSLTGNIDINKLSTIADTFSK